MLVQIPFQSLLEDYRNICGGQDLVWAYALILFFSFLFLSFYFIVLLWVVPTIAIVTGWWNGLMTNLAIVFLTGYVWPFLIKALSLAYSTSFSGKTMI